MSWKYDIVKLQVVMIIVFVVKLCQDWQMCSKLPVLGVRTKDVRSYIELVWVGIEKEWSESFWLCPASKRPCFSLVCCWLRVSVCALPAESPCCPFPTWLAGQLFARDVCWRKFAVALCVWGITQLQGLSPLQKCQICKAKIGASEDLVRSQCVTLL